MSPHDRTSHRRTTRGSDSGFTLPELVITMAITGIIVSAISLALMTLLRSSTESTSRLAESKDITFAQTWVPMDLSSSSDSWGSPDDAQIQASLASEGINFDPSQLPGTNVLTLLRPDGSASGGDDCLVVYRYVGADGDYEIRRYEILNPGLASQAIKAVGVVDEVVPPPADRLAAGWAHGQTIDFAVTVTPRNPVNGSDTGRDLTINFISGDVFTTGGAGVSGSNSLDPPTNGNSGDPAALPSRCGSRTALLIDTSGSVPRNNGHIDTKTAADGFIGAYIGTPSTISLNGFDGVGYGMVMGTVGNSDSWYTPEQRATFVSVLNDNAEVQAMRSRITLLDEIWSDSNGDNNGDGLKWAKYDGGNTNWESAIWNAFRQIDGTDYGVEQPDRIVLITDGEPTRIRGAGGGSAVPPGGSFSQRVQNAWPPAKAIADEAKAQGIVVTGILVGSRADDPTYGPQLKQYLQNVVGSTEWDGAVNPDGSIDIGNAATADWFTGDFDDLGQILRSISIAECGGTVTVQKRIDDGGPLVNPTSGVWDYRNADTKRTLDRSSDSSVTFDFSFGPGETSKTVVISEDGVDGFELSDVTCTGAVSHNYLPDDAAVEVVIQPDRAASCLMISTPTS